MKNRSFLIKIAVALPVVFLLLAFWPGSLPTASAADPKAEAQKFIDEFTARWMELRYAYSQASWNSNTRIVEGDQTNARAENAALERLTSFTGSRTNIETATALLKQKEKLAPLQVKQLNGILYMAAEYPEIAKDLVKERIAAETAQTEKLYGFGFKIDDKPVTPNQLDEILRTSNDTEERRKAWLASKEVGKTLKDGLANLQRLR
ncbi:MAG TPA: M2 family metallopeptidase, partial [Pyrinomonadaceae bacterium]